MFARQVLLSYLYGQRLTILTDHHFCACWLIFATFLAGLCVGLSGFRYTTSPYFTKMAACFQTPNCLFKNFQELSYLLDAGISWPRRTQARATEQRGGRLIVYCCTVRPKPTVFTMTCSTESAIRGRTPSTSKWCVNSAVVLLFMQCRTLPMLCIGTSCTLHRTQQRFFFAENVTFNRAVRGFLPAVSTHQTLYACSAGKLHSANTCLKPFKKSSYIWWSRFVGQREQTVGSSRTSTTLTPFWDSCIFICNNCESGELNSQSHYIST